MKAPIWEFQYGDEMAKINASSARSHLYVRFFIFSLPVDCRVFTTLLVLKTFALA